MQVRVLMQRCLTTHRAARGSVARTLETALVLALPRGCAWRALRFADRRSLHCGGMSPATSVVAVVLRLADRRGLHCGIVIASDTWAQGVHFASRLGGAFIADAKPAALRRAAVPSPRRSAGPSLRSAVRTELAGAEPASPRRSARPSLRMPRHRDVAAVRGDLRLADRRGLHCLVTCFANVVPPVQTSPGQSAGP